MPKTPVNLTRQVRDQEQFMKTGKPGKTGEVAVRVFYLFFRLTKQTIFIPTYDMITSADLAKLFFLHVFSKHGVPSHVTSDRGSEFILHIFRSVGKALDMTLHFTSGYHPEGNG
jgi:hypothetical protein